MGGGVLGDLGVGGLAGVDFGDYSFGIDEEGARGTDQAVDAVGAEDAAVEVHGDGEVDAEVVGEGLGGAAGLLDVDADDEQPGVGVLILRADQSGDFAPAGAAPGSPEVDDERSAAQVGEAEASAVERFELEVGGERANSRSGLEALGLQLGRERHDAGGGRLSTAAQEDQPESEGDQDDDGETGEQGARAVVLARAVGVLGGKLAHCPLSAPRAGQALPKYAATSGQGRAMAAQSIPADDFMAAIRAAGVQDVVLVPDTHQRTLLDELMAAEDIRTVHCSTEDEAIAVSAGLIIGGRRPLMQIQHAGLYACVNNLRGVGLDGRFPIVMLIGLLGRDPELAPREDGSSMVRLAEPLLETLGVPSRLLDGVEDLHHVSEAFEEAEAREGPVALLVGATTS